MVRGTRLKGCNIAIHPSRVSWALHRPILGRCGWQTHTWGVDPAALTRHQGSNGQPDWLPYDRRTANHNLCVSVGKHCIPCSDLGPTVEDGVFRQHPALGYLEFMKMMLPPMILMVVNLSCLINLDLSFVRPWVKRCQNNGVLLLWFWPF